MKLTAYAVAKGEHLLKERAGSNLDATKIVFNVPAAAQGL